MSSNHYYNTSWIGRSLALIFFVLLGSISAYAQLGVGTNSPDPSAELDVTSTTKGVLLPRLTESQRNAINSPAQSLLIYCSDCNPIGLYIYQNSSWSPVNSKLISSDAQNNIYSNNNLNSITTGYNNISIGDSALSATTSGYRNIAIGENALKDNTDGLNNVAIGYRALPENTTGDHNVAVGGLNMSNLTDGNTNVALGWVAMHGLTSGMNNTAIGTGAMFDFLNGNYNTAVGRNAFRRLFSGDNNVALGYQAGYYAGDVSNKLYIENSTTNSPLIGGDFLENKLGINMAISSLTSSSATLTIGGDLQLGSGTGAKVNEFSTDITFAGNSDLAVPTEKAVKTYFDDNIGIRQYANRNFYGDNTNLASLTTGYMNLAIGLDALNKNTTGWDNLAFGDYALSKATTAIHNIAMGYVTLENVTTGSYNTAIGYSALEDLTTGGDNTVVGVGALRRSNTGDDNTALGANAMRNNINGSGNIAIGHKAGMNETGSDKLYIQNNESTSPLIGGDFAQNRVGIDRTMAQLQSGEKFQVNGDASKSSSGNWKANSDKRLKTNIEYLKPEETLHKMLRMRGATFEWNDTVTGTSRPEGLQHGFIAQDIQKVFPTKITKDGQGYLMAAYGDYDPMFVESIRALYEKIQALEAENGELKAENDKLSNVLDGISQDVELLKGLLKIQTNESEAP